MCIGVHSWFRICGQPTNLPALCDPLRKLKFPKALPFAFTGHGAIIAASVLNSARAIEVGVFIVRAFVQLRQIVMNSKEFAGNIQELERRLVTHDRQILTIVQTLKQLASPGPPPRKRRIGFHVEDRE